MPPTPGWLPRFLHPRHAACDYANIDWHSTGEADTPGADARCRIHLACDGHRIATAAFAAYGPPVTIACADWVCEWLHNRTLTAARGLCLRDIEQALALTAEQRYAALLTIDALANALADLG